MARNVDFRCNSCSHEEYDIICEPDTPRRCVRCNELMTEVWFGIKNPQPPTAWGKDESIVVFKKPDGSYSFPARNDKPTPDGCERIVCRSDQDVARIEREAGVRSERRWYDRGSGTARPDDYLPPLPDMTGISFRIK